MNNNNNICNFGNIVFSISNTVIVPVLAIAMESAEVSTLQCDLRVYLAVFPYTLSSRGCTECFWIVENSVNGDGMLRRGVSC